MALRLNYAMVSDFWHVARCSCTAREDEGAPSPRLSLSEVSPDISLYPVNDVGARRIRISSERAKRATMREPGVEMQMDNIGHGWSDSHSRPIQFIANTRNQRCKEEEEED